MSNGQRRGKLLKRAGLVILMGACAMLLSASQASALLIDHFNVGTSFVITTDGDDTDLDASITDDDPDPNVDTWLETGIVGVLGGARDVTLAWQTGNHGNKNRANMFPANHYLSYANDPTMDSMLTLLYDANTIGGFANTDFTVGGTADSVLLHFLTSDLGASVKVTVWDGTNTGTQTILTPAGPNVLVFLFTGFTGAVDFTSVNSIKIEIDSVVNGDYQIDQIETGTIPEPLTMLGMVFGLGSVGAYIRKRRMA